MRYVTILNGVVDNVIIADEMPPRGAQSDTANVGDLYDGEVFTSPEAALEPLEITRSRIWEDIKKYRDNLVENGGFKVGAHWYHSNLLSRTQYISLVMMGASIPANTVWKTLDNGYITMTQTLAGQIFAAGAAQDAVLFAKAAEHKSAIDASSTPDSYDWKTGWPETYQGA